MTTIRHVAEFSGVFVTLLATHGMPAGLAYATCLILRRSRVMRD